MFEFQLYIRENKKTKSFRDYVRYSVVFKITKQDLPKKYLKHPNDIYVKEKMLKTGVHIQNATCFELRGFCLIREGFNLPFKLDMFLLGSSDFNIGGTTIIDFDRKVNAHHCCTVIYNSLLEYFDRETIQNVGRLRLNTNEVREYEV